MTTEEGKRHAKELGTMFIKTSAKTGYCVKQLFRPVGSALLGMADVQERSKEGMAAHQAGQTSEPRQRGWLLPLMQSDLPLTLLICCDISCVLEAQPSHPPASLAALA